jgi:hypothetical protein
MSFNAFAKEQKTYEWFKDSATCARALIVVVRVPIVWADACALCTPRLAIFVVLDGRHFAEDVGNRTQLS